MTDHTTDEVLAVYERACAADNNDAADAANAFMYAAEVLAAHVRTLIAEKDELTAEMQTLNDRIEVLEEEHGDTIDAGDRLDAFLATIATLAGHARTRPLHCEKVSDEIAAAVTEARQQLAQEGGQ